MNAEKYLTLIVLGMVFLFLIAGCDGEEPSYLTSPFIGGTKGLIVEFEEMGFFNEETNMEEIFEGEAFPIEVVVKNKGEVAIEEDDATVTLMGINLDDFTGIVSNGVLSNTAEIEGISEYNEEGGEIILDFTSGDEDAKYTLDVVGMSYDISVFASVVYEYKTYGAVPRVCFSGDLTDTSVCEVDGIKDVFSSAAPIQVNSVEEKRAGSGKILLEFEIENVGSGKVTKPKVAFDSRYNQLSYEISDSSNWECRSSGRTNEARLDEDGKATIVCRWVGTPLTKDDMYTKEVDLTLNYKYKELIQKDLRVKKQ